MFPFIQVMQKYHKYTKVKTLIKQSLCRTFIQYKKQNGGHYLKIWGFRHNPSVSCLYTKNILVLTLRLSGICASYFWKHGKCTEIFYTLLVNIIEILIGLCLCTCKLIYLYSKELPEHGISHCCFYYMLSANSFSDFIEASEYW